MSEQVDLGQLRAGEKLHFYVNTTSLAGAQRIVCTIKRYADKPDSAAVAQVDCRVVSDTRLEVFFGSNVTRSFPITELRYDVQIEPDTSETYTPQWGKIEVKRRVTRALSHDYVASMATHESAPAFGSPTSVPGGISAIASEHLSDPIFGTPLASGNISISPPLHASAPALPAPIAAPYAPFGTLPPARAVWNFSSRLTSAYAGPLIDAANHDTYAVASIGAAAGLGGVIDEAAIAAASGALQGRASALYDQSGNGYHLPASALQFGTVPGAGNIARVPLVYDAGAVTKVNSKPAVKMTTPLLTAQGTGQAFRYGSNVGAGGTWEARNLLGFTGSPNLTIAWVGRCRNDGVGVAAQAGIQGRFAWGIGDYYASQIALVCHTNTVMRVSFGSGGAKDFALTTPWTTFQHVVVQFPAGGTLNDVRLWQDGVELIASATPVALALAVSNWGATTIGCSNYEINYGLWDTRACIVWDSFFGSSDRAVLFSNLSALRDA